MIWCPRQIPRIGYFPRSCFTSPITAVTSSGSPGPLDRNRPSGFMKQISSAVVVGGTMVTLQPFWLRKRMMFSLMPQSTATTLNRWLAVRAYQRFLHAVRLTASWGTGVWLMIRWASATDISMPVRSARLQPRLRMERVSMRVSTPEIPGMPFSSNNSPNVRIARKLEGMSL